MSEKVMTSEDLPREVNRTGWGPGPWDSEENRYEWRSGGYPCLIVRAPLTGALCGYVGVPPGHPWYGKHYGELEDVSIHGGLTYAETGCHGGICHVPQAGESDEVHWLGFDCSHFQDIMPQMEATRRLIMPDAPERPGGMLGFCTYKDLAYVKAEVERLREQAERAKSEANVLPFPNWPEE